MDEPRRLHDASPGDWVNARLTGQGTGLGTSVGSIIPTGFERVVRVLHPLGDGRSWAQFAAAAGRVVHPLVQWCCLDAGFDPSGREDIAPEEGSVPEDTLSAVLSHCPAGEGVVQAVWFGWGSWADRSKPGALMPGWGGRGYRLFTTPQRAIVAWPGMNPHRPQSANLIWPTDQSWCIATDIDFDSTLIAGPADLTEAIHGDIRLESFPVAYHDDLSWCGDTLNPRPDWLTCP